MVGDLEERTGRLAVDEAQANVGVGERGPDFSLERRPGSSFVLFGK